MKHSGGHGQYQGVPGAVAGSRIRHRVSVIPVGRNLIDKWALSSVNTQYPIEEKTIIQLP